MEDLILYIAQRLVDEPEAVHVERVRGRRGPIYKLSVAPNDKGKVIGKEGRVIKAIRQVAEAAAVQQGLTVTIDIV